MKKEEDFESMCYDCGISRYPRKRDMGNIGVSFGECLECGKKKGIIPARDWAYRAGYIDKWT